jgi:hypothetical protein
MKISIVEQGSRKKTDLGDGFYQTLMWTLAVMFCMFVYAFSSGGYTLKVEELVVRGLCFFAGLSGFFMMQKSVGTGNAPERYVIEVPGYVGSFLVFFYFSAYLYVFLIFCVDLKRFVFYIMSQ